MKKKFTFIVALAAVLSLPAYAVKESEVEGIHPYKQVENVSEEIAHWSIYLDAGMSAFDGDNTAKLGSTYSGLFGLGLQYDFTPTWGVDIEYHVTTYGDNMFSKTAQYGNVYDLKTLGHMHNIGANLTYDFIDAFFPHRNQTIFSVYGIVGGGVGVWYYNGADIYYDTNPWFGWSQGRGTWDPDNKKINATMYMSAGVQADFNVCRGFGIGIRAVYDYYVNDYIDGGTSLNNKNNKNNDGLFACTVNFHWSILSKSRSHVRNFASEDAFAQAVDRKKKKDKPQVATGVKDTIVISHKDTLVMKQERIEHTELIQTAEKMDEVYFVYFEPGKSTLDRDAQIAIQQMASRMARNPGMCIDISGFCDATGSVELNEKLAQKRAKVVRDQLVNLYGIDESRLLNVGVGKLTNVEGDFGPNRRVDMRVVNKQQLEEIRQERRQQEEKKAAQQHSSSRGTSSSSASSAVTNRQQAQQQAAALQQAAATEELFNQVSGVSDQERWSNLKIDMGDQTKYIAHEVADKNTTLSRLARKYYGNTFCWVYIYQANTATIKDPSFIWTGAKIAIPELTEEQKSITKEESLQLLKTIKAE